jgi:hypothetical protein
MPGASGGISADNASCQCIIGYYWNPALKKCLCDFSQNFVLINGFCTDCQSVLLSNGMANAFGCVCNNGFTWSSSSSQCICPTGSVIIGLTCISCGSATMPPGAVSADCSACSNSKGFSSQSLGCYACASQVGGANTVINGLCGCNLVGTVWRPSLGACVCDWGQLYYTDIGSTGTSFICRKC